MPLDRDSHWCQKHQVLLLVHLEFDPGSCLFSHISNRLILSLFAVISMRCTIEYIFLVVSTGLPLTMGMADLPCLDLFGWLLAQSVEPLLIRYADHGVGEVKELTISLHKKCVVGAPCLFLPAPPNERAKGRVILTNL